MRMQPQSLHTPDEKVMAATLAANTILIGILARAQAVDISPLDYACFYHPDEGIVMTLASRRFGHA